MNYYIGVDLGGTNVAVGVVTENGDLVSKCNRPTPKGQDAVADAIAAAAKEAAALAGMDVSGAHSIGLASPGFIDPVKGIVEHAFNLGLDHTPLADMITKRLNLPTILENDANAAALGEYVAGAGREYRSLVAVTLGTGVGSGAVLDGKLFTGFNYAGMEAGHMVIREGGWPCTCGRKGCWEAYASATGLIKATREAMESHPESALWKVAPTLEEVNGKTAFDAAGMEDEVAEGVIEFYAASLACGIANLINLLQPEILCIGGGVSKQGENLLAPVRKYLDEQEFTRDSAQRTKLCVAKLGNDAGIIGGALVPLYR